MDGRNYKINLLESLEMKRNENTRQSISLMIEQMLTNRLFQIFSFNRAAVVQVLNILVGLFNKVHFNI